MSPAGTSMLPAVAAATNDQAVKVIVLRGIGRSFCAGYDFGDGFTHWSDSIETEGKWDAGKDFMFATAPQLAPTQKLMSVWRTPKPVIAQVHGYCVGGGSDFALCADLAAAWAAVCFSPHLAATPTFDPELQDIWVSL